MNESAFNWSVNCEEEMQINKAARLHRFLWSYLVCFWNGAPPQHWITIWMTKCHSLCRWGVSSNESLLYLGKTPASVHTVEWSTRSGQLLQLRYLFTLGNKWSSDRREVYENNEIGHKIAEKNSTLFRCWTLSTPLKSIRWTTVLLPFWFHKPHVSSSSRRWTSDRGHAYTDTVKIDVMWSCICEQVALERHGSR